MNNFNPTLAQGQALAWLKSSGRDIPEHQLRDVSVRLYDGEGAGFYFTRRPKWYRDDDPTDGHFNNCDLEDIQRAIAGGARVQLVGYRSESLAVWRNWDSFVGEVFD
jgi:hypothetical protein